MAGWHALVVVNDYIYTICESLIVLRFKQGSKFCMKIPQKYKKKKKIREPSISAITYGIYWFIKICLYTICESLMNILYSLGKDGYQKCVKILQNTL